MNGNTSPDPADEAMVARAHERFAAERRKARKTRRSGAHGALPNLIVIGGLKCGTTSLHHYLNLHPEIRMSRPKELNFFVEELNWELGADWYRGHFPADVAVRGETSPHYTNRPRFQGVAERMKEVLGEDLRLIYMVRHPIDRLLSHYLHNVGGGYESRELAEAVSDPASAYVQRGMYASQLEPYVETFGLNRILVVSREELGAERDATVQAVFGFCGVEPGFTSPEFDREWETGSGKGSGGFRLMDRAVRMPGLRALDRNFDRLPERMRWLVERMVHDPDSGEAAKPELEPALREKLAATFHPDMTQLEGLIGRPLGWNL
jgi:Sulfotransferase domain